MIWRGLLGGGAVLLLSRGRALRAVNRRLLAIRSLLQASVSAAWYLAWSLGVTLADSYAVAAASPLLMTLLAIPLLGEKVGWRRWCSTAVGCCGVLFMLQPGGELWRWESGMLLVATAIMALTRIWTRILTRTDTPDSMAFWVLAAQVPVGLAHAGLARHVAGRRPAAAAAGALGDGGAGLLRRAERHGADPVRPRLRAGAGLGHRALRIHAAALGHRARLPDLGRGAGLDHAGRRRGGDLGRALQRAPRAGAAGAGTAARAGSDRRDAASLPGVEPLRKGAA